MILEADDTGREIDPSRTGKKLKARFIKSSLCSGGECVEVALLADGAVAIRDAKDVSQDPFVFTRTEWSAFIQGAKAGEFDF
jgi:hypothetical protein